MGWFSNKVNCPKCAGVGKYKDSVYTGDDTGGSRPMPETTVKYVTCSKCGGSGKVSEDEA